jgi:hypothetical protein
MPWIDKAPHILARKRYFCEDCHTTFDVRQESGDLTIPECPKCVGASGAATWVPPLVAIGSTKGQAIDLAQKIAEEDFGLTNFNDNQRAGDIAFKPESPMHTAELETNIREMMQAGIPAELPKEHAEKVDNYWQGNMGGIAEQTIATQAVSSAASSAARAEGVDPLSILERGRAGGHMRQNFNVMSATNDIPPELKAAQAARGAGL